MRFAKSVFLIAGIYGLFVITPFFFLEKEMSHVMPPPITHPEYYYGFICAVFSWQVLYLLMARDPARYRVLMLPAVLEKIPYAAIICCLYLQHRVAWSVLAGGGIDFLLGLLFIAAYFKTSAGQGNRC